MLIENQTIWQIGTGDNTRDYTDICLDFEIAIVGPGCQEMLKIILIGTKIIGAHT